jgi:hypothetical protein
MWFCAHIDNKLTLRMWCVIFDFEASDFSFFELDVLVFPGRCILYQGERVCVILQSMKMFVITDK